MTTARGHATYSRLEVNRLGLWLFIISESMLFVGLLAARFAIEGFAVPAEVSQVVGLVITSVLLLSSFTAYRAETALRHGERALGLSSLRLTLILGLIFVAGVAVEWREALHALPPSTSFGTVFFTMTGLHAFHVITGLVFLGIVYGRARAGAYDGGDTWPAEAAAKYWHFVDVVWVFFYVALYLVD
jgi:cytochrome c oxidase subunit 3